MLRQKLPVLSRQEKIMHVRRQIHVWHLNHKLVHNKVYYDMLFELDTTLERLVRDEKLETSRDPLDKWCEENPDSLECRIYDV